ncbi:CIA30 family protein [Palleronia pelagia]|uniref:Complex I intermediate-associated protein 30 (CIA30) n=1 Tax=Palleronia pelagia TaxID=387096 RepID=A0A1H8J6Y0_9RHOB|nr:CIA30 family protein [Palleronia pelagia]SEN76351.1 Complex I intermediate-associated protein 30 (CIA30) [Palleronia pelagia]
MALHGKLIDDASGPAAETDTEWELISDRVMGGVSEGALTTHEVAGRRARHMTGQVSLENDGGFLQMALDLSPDGGAIDASGLEGIEVTARGTGSDYNIHLRTEAVARPWQSYRLTFHAGPDWATHRLPFADVTAHRIDAPFDAATLRRIGIVAIGRRMQVDLAVARLAFY